MLRARRATRGTREGRKPNRSSAACLRLGRGGLLCAPSDGCCARHGWSILPHARRGARLDPRRPLGARGGHSPQNWGRRQHPCGRFGRARARQAAQAPQGRGPAHCGGLPPLSFAPPHGRARRAPDRREQRDEAAGARARRELGAHARVEVERAEPHRARRGGRGGRLVLVVQPTDQARGACRGGGGAVEARARASSGSTCDRLGTGHSPRKAAMPARLRSLRPWGPGWRTAHA